MELDLEFGAYDLLPEAVLVIDRGGTIAFSNSLAAELLGVPGVELVGSPLELLIPPQLRDQAAARLARLFADAGPHPVSLGRLVPALHADGREIPVEVTLRFADDGQHAIVVLRNRTELEGVQEELRQTAERFRVAAEVCADLIWEGDASTGELQYFGDVDGLLGYEPGEFPRTVIAWQQAIHEADLPAVAEAMEKSLETGVFAPPAYRMHRKDGTCVYLEERAVVVDTPDGRRERFVGAATDVTERVLAQQQLEKLTRRLEAEAEYLRAEIKNVHDFDEIVGTSPILLSTLRSVDRVAATDTSVLILGETGTGKELLARAIHARSRRADAPLIKVDCCALPPRTHRKRALRAREGRLHRS
jgi:PAS domain S-box-containing protein